MLKEFLIRKGLSRRESEVASLVAEGLANKQIADKLFVTEKTVKFHLTNIYRKMKLKSRAQLIVFCLPGITFVETQQANVNSAQNNRSQVIQRTGMPTHNGMGETILPHTNSSIGGQGTGGYGTGGGNTGENNGAAS